MHPMLLVPEFDRLSDWTGLWAIEPRAFDSLVSQLQRIDLAAHAAQPPMGIRSALEKVPARNGQSLAVIKVTGTLMKSQSSLGGTSTVQMRRDIRQAASDPEVSGILLAIDSPGGTVAGTDDLANEVKAARRAKPVWAHIDDLGASAAYWVASQAEFIFANSPTALAGSIGTITTVYDMSQAATMAGIKAYCFATGPLKGAGKEGTKITEEQAAYFQQLIDESQQTFDSAVRRGRGLTDKQLADVRTGAIFTAENALSKKLIDGIRPLGKTMEELSRATSGKNAVTSGYEAPIEATTVIDFPSGTLTFVPPSTLVSQSGLSAAPAAAPGAIPNQAPPGRFAMNENWIVEQGFDPATLNPKQRAFLQANWDREQKPNVPVAAIAPALTTAKGANSYEMKLEAARAESDRQTSIDAAVGELLEKNKRFPDRVERINLVREAAIEGGWDLQKTTLELLKEQFHLGPISTVSRDQNITGDVITAALCRHSGLGDVEKRFNPQVLEAVDKQFGSRGLSMMGAIRLGAKRNGWRGDDVKGNEKQVLKAAFREDEYGMQASVGPSTYSIPNILSNVANLHIRVAFEAVEAEWRKLAFVSSVNDYKEISTVALTGDMTYKKVAKGGEVKHGTFGDMLYGNKANLYALLIGIDEQDLVNDSMQALTGASRRMGRGGALTMNEVFWAEWLDDAAFFPTDKSLANYDDGATDSMLTAVGLTNMNGLFRAQTDPDGKPIGIRPRLLIVPPALEGAALTLMNSEFEATTGSGNIWRNRFEVVSSDYLTNPLAWYLAANPQDLAAIEMVFLNGQQMPQTEQADMAIDRLGIVIRGKHSFGARKQEYRAAVKAKGAA